MHGQDLNPIYRELASRIEMADSRYIPQIFALLATPEQARILLALPAASAADLALKVALPRDVVERHIRDLYTKGLVLSRQKGGLRTVYAVSELKDTTGSNPRLEEAIADKLFGLWDAWLDSDEARKFITRLSEAPGQLHPLMRVIPKWRSIRDVAGILPGDDVRHLLRAHEDNLALNLCSCRRIARAHTNTEIPNQLCLVMDKVADYCIDRGAGHRISYREALAFLDSVQDHPLIHLTYNSKSEDRLIGSCGTYCAVCRRSPPRSIIDCAKSRFVASVDSSLCIGPEDCPSGKKCTSVCMFGAPRFVLDATSNSNRAFITDGDCWGCGNCVVQCPAGAITMRLVRPSEFIPDQYVGKF